MQLIYTFSHVNPPGRDLKKFITPIVSRPFFHDTPIHGIIRWIVQVLETAYQSSDQELPEKVSAQELRALASLWAYICHIALNDVLSAAFWRSLGVQRNYLRDLTPIAGAMGLSWWLNTFVNVSLYSHLRSYKVVHTLNHSTKKDYLVYCQYPSGRCVGLV